MKELDYSLVSIHDSLCLNTPSYALFKNIGMVIPEYSEDVSHFPDEIVSLLKTSLQQ